MKNRRASIVALSILVVCLGLVVTLGSQSSSAAPSKGESRPGQLAEMRWIDDPRHIRIPAPPGFNPNRRAPGAANIVVNYLPVGSGSFGDQCTNWPSGAQTAFSYAASLAASLFNSSVTTTIDACWVTNFPNPGILGHGGAIDYRMNFTNAPVADTWYADALANALVGSDLDAANHEIYIGYNANRTDWYYGTDGNPGSNIDLVSVAFHEIFHGLGFIPSFSYSGGAGSWGLEVSPPYHPAAYDRFVYNGSGQLLISTFANPSVALGSQLVSNNLFFRGTNATTANSGIYPQLYAPATWAGGSSIAHLDYAAFSATELMVYAIGAGQSKHSPGPVSEGVMKDLGWTTGTSGTPTPTPTPTITTIPGANKLNLPLVLRNFPAATATPTATPTTPTASWATIVSESFEGSFPGVWTLSSAGGYTWGKRNCRAFGGSSSGWGVGGGTNGAALPCGSNYPNSADSWMVYGPFSLVGATAGDLSFKLWLNSELTNDYVGRYASIDGANFWGSRTSGNTAGWIDRTLDLTNVFSLGNLMGQPNVWVALMFASNSSNALAEGGHVDNVVLRKCPSGATCLAGSNPALSGNSMITEAPDQVTLRR